MNTTRRSFLVSGCKLALTPAALSITRFASASAPTEGGLADLSASSAIDAMKKGEMKAEAYMTALLDRAARFSKLNAFRTLNREKALESAAMADRLRATGSPLGLLHGLPIPVKDSFNSATLPTSNGTASMRDWVPRQDATTLSLIISRGALLMGKTNLHEMSFGWTSNNDEFGAVLNPYDTSRVPGGSSGGSAVAVSARMAPLALGEDTLGSIRVPASMCGVVGFRPTLGRYPSAGIMPLTNNKFDQPGPIARCVADIALFDAAMLGQTSPVVAMPMNGTRIGVPQACSKVLIPMSTALSGQH
ncbi:MAG: hypothetical protein IPJ48_08420 [Propionivibrio sp.]|uniref:Amidase domain-containing protein n=1 Tax=Candidatus Propionivibrio dominans TaxID=2954373 RepID=A0A9D7I7B5_9RHOO|nr:hypothetical protein [Candidatus Propionivibrio dominans]